VSKIRFVEGAVVAGPGDIFPQEEITDHEHGCNWIFKHGSFLKKNTF